MYEEKLSKPTTCIGCGYCCRKAPCAAAVRVYGLAARPCPAMYWDGSRYWCDLCQKPGDVGLRYRQELAIGEGCCSSLNSDRRAIPPPPVPKEEAPYLLSADAQALLRRLGRELICPDALWLAIMGASKDLGQPGFAKAALHALKQNRPKHVGEFIGEIEK